MYFPINTTSLHNLLGDDMSMENELDLTLRTEKDPDVRERIRMIRILKKGSSSYKVAEQFGCDHKTPLNWLYRYETDGLDGLRTRLKSGRPKAISKATERRIRKRIGDGVGWRTIAVRELIKKETGVSYTERHIIRLMHVWGFEKIKPRPKHILADEKEREAFLKKRLKSSPNARKTGLWFAKTNQ
jgi:transposase